MWFHRWFQCDFQMQFQCDFTACNITGVLSFASVFEDFGHNFPTCLCRAYHNLICNKFILKNKKLSKILEIEKF